MIYIPTPYLVMTDIFWWLEWIVSLQQSVLLLNALWSPFPDDSRSVEPPNTLERFVKWTTSRTLKVCVLVKSYMWAPQQNLANLSCLSSRDLLKSSAALGTVGAPVYILMWGPFIRGGFGKFEYKMSNCNTDFRYFRVPKSEIKPCYWPYRGKGATKSPHGYARRLCKI